MLLRIEPSNSRLQFWRTNHYNIFHMLIFYICGLIVDSDIKDMTAGSLSQRITNQLMGLKGLFQQLNEIRLYLDKVAKGQLPVNHQIVYLLQVGLRILQMCVDAILLDKVE